MKVLTINRETNIAIIKTKKLWATLLLAVAIMCMAGYVLGTILVRLF